MKKALKVIGIGLAGLFVLVFVISLIPNSEKKLQEVNNNLKQTSEQMQAKIDAKTQPSTPLSEEDQIKELVKKQITDDEKVRKIDVQSQIDGGWGVFIEYEANNKGTRVERKNRIDDTMASIYNALFSSSFNIQQATVNAYMLVPLESANETIPVYKTIMKKSFLEKVMFNEYEPNSEERNKALRNLWNVSIYNEEYLTRT